MCVRSARNKPKIIAFAMQCFISRYTRQSDQYSVAKWIRNPQVTNPSQIANKQAE